MTARALMIQGTGSDVGKSLLVAGLARAFARRGLRVRAVQAAEHVEQRRGHRRRRRDRPRPGAAGAGRARAAQRPHEPGAAEARERDRRAGHRAGPRRRQLRGARIPGAESRSCWPPVLDSFARLAREADLVLVEGAGSPAEVNLRAGDIANMGFAARRRRAGRARRRHRPRRRHRQPRRHPRGARPGRAARSRASSSTSSAATPRCSTTADDDRGAHRLAGLGVVPCFADAARSPGRRRARPRRGRPRGPRRAEDRRARACRASPISTTSIRCALEPGVALVLRAAGRADPGRRRARASCPARSPPSPTSPSCARRAGTSTSPRIVRRGGHVLGLCGGYQMLGRGIADPRRHRGAARRPSPGLGLLDVETVLTPQKTTRAGRRAPSRLRRARGGLRDPSRPHRGARTPPARCSP